jgi:hypothetical protein
MKIVQTARFSRIELLEPTLREDFSPVLLALRFGHLHSES